MNVPDQVPVQFDVGRLVFYQQFQAGISRSEIIDGGLKSKVLDELQVLQQIPLIGQVLRLKHFKNDVLHRDAASIDAWKVAVMFRSIS